MVKHTVVLSTITPKRKYLQLGIYSLQAYAQKYFSDTNSIKIQIDIINPTKYVAADAFEWPYFDDKKLVYHADRINKLKPKILGFSCFSWNIESILKICKIIKSINPNISIILGGPEASDNAEAILRNEKSVDIIVRDEGEETFLEILESIFLKKYDIKKISSITYKLNNKIISTPDRKSLDLCKIPSPFSNNLIDINENIDMVLETSRGCPFNCAYCTYSIRGNHILRFFPLEKVQNEIKYLLKNKIKRLWINDDNFNINPDRSRKILETIKKYQIATQIGIFLNASGWKIDDSLVSLLKKNKIHSIIGIQSTDMNVLKTIRRITNMAALEDNLIKFDKYRIKYTVHFIAGLPGETFEGIKKSLDWISRFNPEFIEYYILILFKGTNLYANAKKLGIKFTKKYRYMPHISETRSLNKKDISKIRKMSNAFKILYNRKLLRKTAILFSRKYNIRFSKILEEWGKNIKFVFDDTTYLKEIQKQFAEHIVKKFHIKINKAELNILLKSDFLEYLKNKRVGLG